MYETAFAQELIKNLKVDFLNKPKQRFFRVSFDKNVAKNLNLDIVKEELKECFNVEITENYWTISEFDLSKFNM